MTAATPGQAAYEAYQRAEASQLRSPEGRRLARQGKGWETLSAAGQSWWEAAAQAAIDVFLAGDSVSAESIREAIAAQQPQPAPGIPLRSDAETCAMLRADLADAEAMLARWPKCPEGCNCRIGIEEDADRNECGCDGPCNGDDNSGPASQLHEGDWDDAVSEATS
jgi:hypothetical protein